MTVLGYLAKLEKGLELPFEAHFLHDFSIKMFLIFVELLYQWTKFQSHTLFLSQDIKQTVLLTFYLGS